jgi:hypothetical protein
MTETLALCAGWAGLIAEIALLGWLLARHNR